MDSARGWYLIAVGGGIIPGMLDPHDRDQVRRRIARLRERGPYIGPRTLGCYPRRVLDLVSWRVAFRRRGGTIVIPVTLQRAAMVSLLRAWLDNPEIQPWGALSTFRTCDLQQDLYERHLAGGPLAAPPGKSWHNVGLAFDLYPRRSGAYAAEDREALIAHGWEPLGSIDPPHFTHRRARRA